MLSSDLIKALNISLDYYRKKIRSTHFSDYKLKKEYECIISELELVVDSKSVKYLLIDTQLKFYLEEALSELVADGASLEYSKLLLNLEGSLNISRICYS